MSDMNSRNTESTTRKRKNTEPIKSIIIKMEHFKIPKLLKDSTASNFATKNLIEVNDLSGGQYSANENIMFKNPMLRSDFWDYSDAYIVVRGTISVTGTNAAERTNKKLSSRIMQHLGHAHQESITNL